MLTYISSQPYVDRGAPTKSQRALSRVATVCERPSNRHLTPIDIDSHLRHCTRRPARTARGHHPVAPVVVGRDARVIRAIHHLGSALDLFTSKKPEWGVTEASIELGLAKSSVHELFASLAEIGILEQMPTRRYRLGWRLANLTRTLVASNEDRGRIVDGMQQLVQRLGVTTNLAVLDRGRVVYLHRAVGRQGLQTPTEIGRRLHAHISGVGKVLLAQLTPQEIDEVIAVEGLPPYTAATITSREDFIAELHRIRERGWAEDLEEAVLGVCCVAAPIRNGGHAIAAISVVDSPPTFAHNRERYRREIVSMARGLST